MSLFSEQAKKRKRSGEKKRSLAETLANDELDQFGYDKRQASDDFQVAEEDFMRKRRG